MGGGQALVLGIVALVMAGFCALDVREVAHQLGESRSGLAIVAAVVAALHLAAAVLAARVALATRHRAPPRPPRNRVLARPRGLASSARIAGGIP